MRRRCVPSVRRTARVIGTVRRPIVPGGGNDVTVRRQPEARLRRSCRPTYRETSCRVFAYKKISVTSAERASKITRIVTVYG